jgi:hypothetical protein
MMNKLQYSIEQCHIILLNIWHKSYHSVSPTGCFVDLGKQAKLGYGGLILGSNRLSLLPPAASKIDA